MFSQQPGRSLAERLMSFLRNRMTLASVGIVVATIFFTSIGMTAWWAIRSQSQSLKRGRIDQVASIGSVLAKTVEIMMANDEMSAVRRVMAETAQEHDLTHCRIVLPSGGVVADKDPKQITLQDLEATWSGTAPPPVTDLLQDERITQSFNLQVPGRGQASLEITASVVPSAARSWPLQAKIGIINIGALIALLLLHRSMRLRVRAISAVRQALLTHDRRRGSLAELQINPDWGREAQAWNNIIREQEAQREQLTLRSATTAFNSRRGNNSDLQAACNALWQGLILVDKDLKPKYANGAAAVLLQVSRETLADSPVTDLIDDADVQDAIRQATEHPMRHRTIVESERTHDDTTSVLRFIVRPVRREDPGVAMIVIEDITQQRVAEKSRGAFIANATHELRNPLTNIRLYVETALDDGQQDPAGTANCLNVINQETHRLERMVGDMLSVAQIEAGTLQLKTDDVRLDEVFSDLQKDYALQAKEKNVELTFRLPPKLPVIRADRDKFMVGLHNLVSNALKYTPAGGTVTVTVDASDGELVTDVTDTGIGISADDASRVFEKYFRARDRRIAGVPGSGLGLAIAREIIRLHGGDITVQSEMDKGSTFRLVLPIDREAA